MENKKTVNNPSRPLILELRDSKQELIDAVNGVIQKHNLSCYFVRGMLEEILLSVKDIAEQELQSAETQYNKALENSQEAKEE